MQPTPAASGFKYWAFISYSHLDNRATRPDGTRARVAWANWLQEALETYPIPAELAGHPSSRGELIPDRLYPTFRDESELPSDPDLGRTIRDALAQSRYLIVICSPRSAASVYCNEEVRVFRELGRGDRILPLIIDGEPGKGGTRECLPPALREGAEPLCADARIGESREEPDAHAWGIATEPQRRTLLKLIAGMLGVGFDDLYGRDQQRQAAQARARAAAIRSARWLGLAACAALTVLATLSLPPQQWLQANGFNVLQRLMPRERTNTPAVVVAIDEVALAKHGQWPWPRSRLAKLIEQISHAGPAAIGIELIMPEPDRASPRRLAATIEGLDAELARRIERLPDNDVMLGDAIAGHRVVLSAVAQDDVVPEAQPLPGPALAGAALPEDAPTFRSLLRSVPAIEAHAAGSGILNGLDEPDGAIHRIWLFVRAGDRAVPSLEMELLRVADGARTYGLEARGGAPHVQLGELDLPLGTDASLWLRFGAYEPSRYYSAAKVLDGGADPAAFKDKWVFVAATFTGGVDSASIPLGVRVPGVEVRMQALENLFEGSWLRRPDGMRWLEAGLLFLGGVVLAALVPVLSPAAALGLFALLLTAVSASASVAYACGWLLDAATPAAGFALVFVVVAASRRGLR